MDQPGGHPSEARNGVSEWFRTTKRTFGTTRRNSSNFAGGTKNASMMTSVAPKATISRWMKLLSTTWTSFVPDPSFGQHLGDEPGAGCRGRCSGARRCVPLPSRRSNKGCHATSSKKSTRRCVPGFWAKVIRAAPDEGCADSAAAHGTTAGGWRLWRGVDTPWSRLRRPCPLSPLRSPSDSRRKPRRWRRRRLDARAANRVMFLSGMERRRERRGSRPEAEAAR